MRRFLAALVALSAGSACAVAQDSSEHFYKGKIVNIIVGSDAGGGYDAYARLVAHHLGEHIPGAPTITVRNMPGAGSNRAAGYIAVQAPKDGTTIGALQASAILFPLMYERKLQHDPSQFIMIGSANRSVYLCAVRADAPVKSFAEAFEKEVIIGTGAEGASLRELPVLLVNVLGVKLRLVGGYTGSRDITLAMERNEVHGMCGMDWSSLITQKRDWIESGFVRAIAQEDLVGHPELNKLGVPLTPSFAKTADDRQVLEVIYSGNAFGRPFLLPGGTPADRVAALRAAFEATMKDARFLADAERELQDTVSKLYTTPPAIIERVKRALVLNAAPR
jgi:tripartite-type tricarboxylate transporter receptor subunit TctC